MHGDVELKLWLLQELELCTAALGICALASYGCCGS